MKKCNKCLEVKELSDFSKDKSRKDGFQNKCKACDKQRMKEYYQENPEAFSERMKEWRQSLKDGYHHVYILPIEHYAGTTDCIPHRMANHKNTHGRNTDNYEIVGSYEKREDARNHESRLHDQGYNGRHINNSYK